MILKKQIKTGNTLTSHQVAVAIITIQLRKIELGWKLGLRQTLQILNTILKTNRSTMHKMGIKQVFNIISKCFSTSQLRNYPHLTPHIQESVQWPLIISTLPPVKI